MKNIIVTSADSVFFIELQSLILSLVDVLTPPRPVISVIDLGLEKDELQWLHDQGVVVANGMTLSQKFDLPIETPMEMSICLRAYLPDIFPGHDSYLWIDADAWVQDPMAIEHYFQLTAAYDVVAALEMDRTYTFERLPNPRWQYVYSWFFEGGFGKKIASKISILPVLNCGIFSARADSQLWKKWPETIWQIIKKQNSFFMADMTAINYLYYEKKISALLLPAEYNWLVFFSWPKFNQIRKKFITPLPPHSLIKIMHLAGIKDRRNLKARITNKDNTTEEISLLYTGEKNK